MDEITVRVPGTSANLGPGYDCLGVALRLYNRVTLRRGEAPADHPMVAEAAAAFFAEAALDPFPFGWRIEGDVPPARGLGSSVTLRLGVLHGLNALAGEPLHRDRIFTLCSQLEGHPDNAAPAEYGGFTVADGFHHYAFPVDEELKFVLAIPPFEVVTREARQVLPEQLPLHEAVASSAGACRIVAAFAMRNYATLENAFEDYFHQPYRRPLVPFLDDAIQAGVAAGALGGFLSGSGSTVACVTLREPEKVGAAMLTAIAREGTRLVIVSADNEGTIIGN